MLPLPQMQPCVHLRATISSTHEEATGVLMRGDNIEVQVLHRGDLPKLHKFTLSASSIDGLLAVTVSHTQPDGNRRTLYHEDIGRRRELADELDWSSLAPPPNRPARIRRAL